MATTDAPKVKHRSHVSGFSIAFGPIEIVGDLLTTKIVNADKEEKLRMVCSLCSEPHGVSQFYQCPNDVTHVLAPADCGRAKEDEDGNLIALTDEQVKQAKASAYPARQLHVHVHQYEEVKDYLVTDGSAYIFRPTAGSSYGVMLDILKTRADLVFMGVTNIRDNDYLMRVTVGMNGQLMLESLVWPGDLKAVDAPAYEYEPKWFQMAEQFLTAIVEPFDADGYKKEARERMALLVETVKAGTPVPKPAAKKREEVDMEALLTAALASVGK